MELRFGGPEGLLLVSGSLWGTVYVAIKLGLPEGDPYLFALLRFALGALVLLAFVAYLGRFDRAALKDRTLWLVGLLNAASIAVQNVGMTMTTATNAVLLFNTCVGFVAIFAAIILKERLAKRVLLGIAVGMGGVLLITTGGDLTAIYSGTFQGNLLVFLSGVLWALCTVYLKRIIDRQGDVFMVTAGMFIISTLFLVPTALLFTSDYSMGPVAWASIIWVGVLGTGVAFLLYNIGLRRVSVTAATVILLSEVVFTMMFSFFLLGEVPTGSIALGGVMVVVSVLMIALSTAPEGGAGPGDPR